MSLPAFVSAVASGGTRAQKIAILASETDEATGIVNDTTECDKDYWEGTGPQGTTGTAYSLLLDLLDLISGNESYTGLNLNGKIRFSDSGLSLMAGAAVNGRVTIGSGVELITVNGSLLLVENDVAIDGNCMINGDVGGLTATVGALKMNESAISDPATSMTVFEPTENADFRHSHGLSTVDCLAFENEAGFGPRLAGAFSWWNNSAHPGDGSYTDFATMVLDLAGSLTVGELKADGLTGRAWSGPTLAVVGDASAGAALRLAVTGLDGSTSIGFQGGFDPEAENDNDGRSVFLIKHTFQNLLSRLAIQHTSAGYPNADMVTFEMDEDDENIVFRSMYKSGGPWAWLHVKILSSADFAIDLSPQQWQPGNRTAGAGGNSPALIDGTPVPGIRLNNGVSTDFSWGRLGFDSWEDSAALRLWCDELNGTTRGLIALGPPAGYLSDPIDRLAYVPENTSIGVNIRSKWLATNHASRSGLWLGDGGDQLAGRLWMQDSAGHRASILMGTDYEEFFAYCRNGSLYTAPGSYDETQLGLLGAIGSHKIPFVETSEYGITAAGMIDVIQQHSDPDGGAAIVIRSTLISDPGTRLYICNGDPTTPEWIYFTADGSVAD